MDKSPTHKQIAAALKVSRPYVTRLVSLGMPTASIPDARRWFNQQKRAAGCGKNAPANLNAARLENMLLKNQLLREELKQIEDKSELVSVQRLVDAMEVFLTFARMSFLRQLEMDAENLAAASTPDKAYTTARGLVEEGLFSGLLGLMAQAQVLGDDPRMLAVVQEVIRSMSRYNDDEVNACLAEFSALMRAHPDKFETEMIPKVLVDGAAARAEKAITRHLEEFIARTACRLPGGGTEANGNILHQHMAPAIAEIQREIGLFRVEIGSPVVTNESVDDRCAVFWRNWQRVCGVRAEVLERRAKEQP
jgi:hypothetical protein